MTTPGGGATTRAAIVSGSGRAAIAIVRVWGPDALAVADRAFRPHRGARLAETAAGRPRLGRIGDGLGDEVVAIVGDGGSEVTIQCHGGPAAIALVVDALAASGAVAASAVDYARAHAPDALAADAAADLIDATTLKTAEILLDQSTGLLGRAVRGAIDGLDRGDPAAPAILDGLIARSAVGLRLVSGFSVAIAGRPNVGKSRLLNAIAGYDRAIVSPVAGTTRDAVRLATAVDGWPVEFVDTAGLREAADPIEAVAVARAGEAHRRADLVLVVLDRSGPIEAADLAILADHPGALVAANKVDLPAAWHAADLAALPVSAEAGDGLGPLLSAIGRRLVGDDPPGPGSAVPCRRGHRAALLRARRDLDAGRPVAAADRLRRLLGSGDDPTGSGGSSERDSGAAG